MNDKQSHTPSTWYWSDAYKSTDTGGKTWSLIGADGYGILSCELDNSPQGIGHDANALLIESTPELLEALEKIHTKLCEARGKPAFEAMYDNEWCIDECRRVIAKSTGEPK